MIIDNNSNLSSDNNQHQPQNDSQYSVHSIVRNESLNEIGLYAMALVPAKLLPLYQSLWRGVEIFTMESLPFL